MNRRGTGTKALALVLALLCGQQAIAAPRKAATRGGKRGAHTAKPAAADPAPSTDSAPAPVAEQPAAAADKPVVAADKPADKPPPAEQPAPAPAPAPVAEKPVVAKDPAPVAAAKPAVAKEKKARRLRVTILPFPEKNFPENSAVSLQRELSEGLRRNNRLDMKDLDVRLAEFAQEMPFEQVELARTTLQGGQEAFRNLNLNAAIAQLSDAVDQLVAVLPYIKKQELADAMMALAVAQQQKGNTKAMQLTLKRLLIWRSNYQLDTTQFPEQISAPLEEARTQVAQLPQGQAKVLSEPQGPQVFVDGDFAGVAPTVLNSLAVGEHYVTFKKLGYKRGLRIATVIPGQTLQVLGKLPRAEKYLLVEQAVERIGPKIGQSPLDPVVDNLRETLFLDHAVILRLQKAGTMSSTTEEVVLTAYLYDLRSRALLKQTTEKIRMANGVPPDGVLQQLAEKLYQGVDYDNDLRAPEDAPPPLVAQQQPLYKRWWFWTALGVIVAGGASAAAVGILSRAPTCPDGHVCTGELVYSLRIPF